MKIGRVGCAIELFPFSFRAVPVPLIPNYLLIAFCRPCKIETAQVLQGRQNTMNLLLLIMLVAVHRCGLMWICVNWCGLMWVDVD